MRISTSWRTTRSRSRTGCSLPTDQTRFRTANPTKRSTSTLETHTSASRPASNGSKVNKACQGPKLPALIAIKHSSFLRTMGFTAQRLRSGYGLYQSCTGLLCPPQPLRGRRRHVFRTLVRDKLACI